jgi:hypothetical protein
MFCSDECVNLDAANKVLDLFKDKDYRRFMRDALAETIWDFGRPSRLEMKRYLVTLHPPNKPEHVYMTMRVRLDKKDTVEHRHIMASLFSQIAPLIDSKYPKQPKGLSLIMHQETAKTILKLHPEIRTVHAPPLKSMAEILHKFRYAKFDFSDPDKTEWDWWYDYYALSQGITLDNMIKYFNNLIKETGLDAEAFENLTISEAMKTFETMTPPLNKIPVSRELFKAIGLKD